jgi:hypothetical protein
VLSRRQCQWGMAHPGELLTSAAGLKRQGVHTPQVIIQHL